MKKSIILLVVGIAMMFTTSCRWIHETFYSVEGCAEWYCEELYDAAADEDKKKFVERREDLDDWVDGLDKSELRKARKAVERWAEDNKKKATIMYGYAIELGLD